MINSRAAALTGTAKHVAHIVHVFVGVVGVVLGSLELIDNGIIGRRCV